MTAARTGRTEPVEALLQAGARVDAQENAGDPPLMWPAAEGNVAVVECLLNAGADHRIALPRSGFTAFFFAVGVVAPVCSLRRRSSEAGRKLIFS